jgi:hypothetical protein
MARGPEAKLYQKFKKAATSLSMIRLENKALLGTPDLLIQNIRGTFFTVELKVAKGNLVALSPHQVSFHMKHQVNTFLLVSCSPELGSYRLYTGSRIMELVDLGLKLEPFCLGLVPIIILLESL